MLNSGANSALEIGGFDKVIGCGLWFTGWRTALLVVCSLKNVNVKEQVGGWDNYGGAKPTVLVNTS
jgi:hypothetical protein